MIDKTKAICVRVAPFGRTSHVVTWLTEDYGCLATVIKGACRPKSAFLGQYDLYYTCELLFYAREHGGTHIARECFPLATRDSLRVNWRSAAVASYLSDLARRGGGLGDGSHGDLWFRTLEKALDALCDGSSPLEVMLWCELRQLCLGGWSPRMEECEPCGRNPRVMRRFSLSEGRVVCEHNPSKSEMDDTVVLPERVRSHIEAWQQSSDAPPATRNTPERDRDFLGTQRFLGMFLAFHQELSPDVRVGTLELLHFAGFP